MINSFDIFQNHFKIILPEFFFVSAIFIILIYGTLYNASAYYKYPILTYIIGWLSVQTLFITLFLIINSNGPSTAVIFNNVLIIDEFTLLIKTIVLIGAISTILISFKYTLNQKLSARVNEFMILILFSTLSMLLIISSFDLISMYLAIELQSLSFYVLAAFQRNNEFSTEAGLKYFILGAISSGLLLFGESIIYGFTGLTNFEELTKLFSVVPILENSLINHPFVNNTEQINNFIPFLSTSFLNWTFVELINIGLLFILIAFLFKISAVPFHLWTPDVYEGAPTTITAFFAITPKIAILALLLRLCMFTFYDLIDSWQYVIIITSFLSMFIGTLGAIQQNKIKRLLAYSSIAHVGYLLIGLATGTIESIEALLIYAILYTLTIICIFSIILILSRENFNIIKNDSNIHINFQPTSLYVKWLPDFADIYKHTIIEPNEKKVNTRSAVKIIPSKLSFESSKYKIINQPYQKFKWHFANLIEGNPIWNPYYSLKPIQFFKQEAPKEQKTNYVKHITDFSSLSRTNPLLAISASLIFFSNAGIPPLAGFYGKLNVFLTAIENSMYFLALAGILCSVIGAFYSIRLVKIIYFHSMTNKHWDFYQSINKEHSLILAFTFFFTLFFFLSPSFLFLSAHSAAITLCI